MSKKTSRTSLATLSAVALLAAACSGGDEGGGGGSTSGGDVVTVWTFEEQPDRLATTEAIIEDFTAESGVEVDLVGTNEDQFIQLLTAAAAADELPDVVAGIPLANIRTLSANELLDTDAASRVVSELGEDTFTEAALSLTREGDTQLAVPSDGFPVSLIYRQDLFEEKGLAEPRTYQDVLAAARSFDGSDVAGFVAGTAPDTAFTGQTFEFAAQANGCDLLDDSGEVALDSEACVAAFEFYGELVRDHSVPGAMDSTATKTTYMAGDAAMTMWATYILDEMAGLVDGALPSCQECADDPGFIARNSGFVSTLEGPDGAGPVGYSEVTSWAILDGSAEGSADFVQYLMSDGYLDWLSFAPEGKFPARQGTQDSAEEYVMGWQELEAGVDTKAPLTDFYDADAIAELQASVESFSRWGMGEGQGDVIGAVVGENVIPQAVAGLAQGELDAPGAAEQAAEAVREIKGSR